MWAKSFRRLQMRKITQRSSPTNLAATAAGLSPSLCMMKMECSWQPWPQAWKAIAKPLSLAGGGGCETRKGNGRWANPSVPMCCPESRGCWQSDDCLRLNIPPFENLCRNVSLHSSRSLRTQRGETHRHQIGSSDADCTGGVRLRRMGPIWGAGKRSPPWRIFPLGRARLVMSASLLMGSKSPRRREMALSDQDIIALGAWPRQSAFDRAGKFQTPKGYVSGAPGLACSGPKGITADVSSNHTKASN
jgi:hypothetical protein